MRTRSLLHRSVLVRQISQVGVCLFERGWGVFKTFPAPCGQAVCCLCACVCRPMYILLMHVFLK
jgi:hypothetical protein